jgi:hypothetical protein
MKIEQALLIFIAVVKSTKSGEAIILPDNFNEAREIVRKYGNLEKELAAELLK